MAVDSRALGQAGLSWRDDVDGFAGVAADAGRGAQHDLRSVTSITEEFVVQRFLPAATLANSREQRL